MKWIHYITIVSRSMFNFISIIISGGGLFWISGLVRLALFKLCLYIIIILQGVQSIIIRSSLARELPPHELGTVFAVNEILVSLLPLATAPLASAVYNATSCQQCLQVTILYQIYMNKARYPPPPSSYLVLWSLSFLSIISSQKPQEMALLKGNQSII